TAKGELDTIARWKTRPDGIALAPNGRILYVSDPDARAIRGYDLDRQGVASNERTVIGKISVIPGGIRTDEKGNVYVATKGVSVYTPQGQLIKDIALGEMASNLAFGDPDFQTLFVTARTSVYRIRLNVKGSLPYAPQVP